MRNLHLLSSGVRALPPATPGAATITATAVDVDQGVLYVTTQNLGEAEVVIQVWRGHDEDGLECIASVTSPSVEGLHVIPQIICFTIMQDTRCLCIVTRSGDIATLSIDYEPPISTSLPQVDVVGTVSPGVLCASFSPDASLLVLFTSAPNPTLIIMTTPSFDVVSEAPVHTADYGEDKPINVGWGSKATQFHGSLGKTAALSQPPDECGTSSPDDDAVPRISWRGDAQFFAVSTLQGRRRVLRMYDRAGVLQSTAEDVSGLEHPMTWRPNGGLIASTQRFGNVPARADAHPAGAVTGDGSWSLGNGRDGRHDVIFFERNGLRHGGFTLRERGARGSESRMLSETIKVDDNPNARDVRCWGYRVRELGWNSDSSILSVWVERDAGDVVQLWTTGNYHWYLKLEIPTSFQDMDRRFSSVEWHPEDPFRLILSTRQKVLDTRLTLYTAASYLPPPNDTGLVGVVDGDHILLTPFRTQNVPPPMASYQLSLTVSPPCADQTTDPSLPSSTFELTDGPPIHIAFSHSNSYDVMAAIFASGEVGVWEVRTVLGQKRGKRVGVVPKIRWKGSMKASGSDQRQIRVQGDEQVCIIGVLGQNVGKGDFLCVAELVRGERHAMYDVRRQWDMVMPGRMGSLMEQYGSEGGFIWQATDGGLWDVRDELRGPHLVAQFPVFCESATRVTFPGTPLQALFVGLSASKFYVTSSKSSKSSHSPVPPTDDALNLMPPEEGPPRVVDEKILNLSHSCSSYTIAGSYLIWTTTAPTHEAVFARLDNIRDAVRQSSALLPSLLASFERRSVERGARIVTAVPSAMCLVLQMPRGNLETIMPRPLVMEQVTIAVNRGDYRAAFLACRKHRVDLNVLIELNSTKFTDSLRSFVEQLDDVDYINLFLSGLGRSSQPPEIIGALCDGIRHELEQRDITKFVNSILTAHVVKTPPDYVAGLALLLRLRGTHPRLVEEAVKYIIFLVDADRLFETALGMYDFSLVLLVAQHSQKDPREYLPFLRSLRALDGPYQRFKIDDHLKRHEKALQGLHHAGPAHFEEAKAYAETHHLYSEALCIWKDEPSGYSAMLELYGDYLFERREFQQAALAFVQASRTQKAMVAYEKALDWRELFAIVIQEGMMGEKLFEMARRVAEGLGSKRRHAEAARVLLDYVDDVDEAVASLARGSEWSEGRRIATLRQRDDLILAVILPGMLEARSSISDEIEEIRELLEKQVGRLDELAAKKIVGPNAFYGIDDENLANVDVMTDVSNPGTVFTRYTVAPTASSNRSRRTSRSKRKLDRKAGRKGTVEEEEYLLKSLSKLVARLEVVKAEAHSLLPHLLVFSDHAAEGRALQSEVETLQRDMQDHVNRIWKEREAPPQELNLNQELNSGIQKNLTEIVPKPGISSYVP